MAVPALARCRCITELVGDVDELPFHSRMSLCSLVAAGLDVEAYLRQ
jgi:hypothetical protein